MATYTVKLKDGSIITATADKADDAWPALRLTKADGELVAAWYGDTVMSITSDADVVIDTPAPPAAPPVEPPVNEPEAE